MLSALAISGCSLIGVRTAEEPNYELLKQEGDFELRLYPKMWLASTTVASGDYPQAVSEGFRRLFKYISGDSNKENSKIPMTAPVLSTANEQSWEIAFVMPVGWKAEQIPLPTDPTISLREIKNSRVAVRRYSGNNSQQLIKSNLADLETWMGKRGWKKNGPPYTAGYDPPWTLWFLRRNEVHWPVSEN